MDDIVETARRAEGSDLLPKVSFGLMNAEQLILRMADTIETMRARVAELEIALYNESRSKLEEAYNKALEDAEKVADSFVNRAQNAYQFDTANSIAFRIRALRDRT